MTSIRQFVKTAVWALYGTDEQAFRRVMDAWNGQQAEDPLLSVLTARLKDGGLFILDHVEHLSRSREIDAWFSTLLNHCQKCWF